MKREIKFRHWRPSNKVMTAGHSVLTLISTSTGLEDFWEELVWMQFAGKSDKNGKEIYEGDIVKNTTEKSVFGNWDGIFEYKQVTTETLYVVDFDKKWCAFRFTDRNEWGRFEIIGNIYENPELLNSIK